MQTQKFTAKKSFRVDELAKELGVKKFIIKNWEKQFDIKKCGSDNKYSQEDLKIFATIKNLVFIKKMPFSVAKKHLDEALSLDSTSFDGTSSDSTSLDGASSDNTSSNQSFTTPTQAPDQDSNQEIEATQSSQESCIAEYECTQEAKSLSFPDITTQTSDPVEKHEVLEASTHESAQESVIEQWILDQITAAQVSSTINCAQVQHETTHEEILAAKVSDDITEVKPAFKEKEEFLRSLQSFKEQLLRIHEQLK